MLVKKNFGKKKFGPKKDLVKKKIWPKENFGPKNFWSEKKFWSRKILVQRILVQNEFWFKNLSFPNGDRLQRQHLCQKLGVEGLSNNVL